MKEFVLKDEHIKLLKRAVVVWDDCEFGAPEIDPKRPYGNSNVIYDIAEILKESIETCPHCGEPLKEVNENHYNKLHKETKTALQIFLHTGKMEPGLYVLWNDYGTDWKKKEKE